MNVGQSEWKEVVANSNHFCQVIQLIRGILIVTRSEQLHFHFPPFRPLSQIQLP